MDRTGTIFQISVSRGGVPKLPVPEATVDLLGLTTDRQADQKNHGGQERALCLFSVERILALRADGNPINPGSAGENITTMDLDWRYVVPGARLRLGEGVEIECTRWTTPCWKNAQWFKDGDFTQMDESKHPGRSRIYARVLRGGIIRQGDPVTVLDETTADRVARLQPKTFRWPRDFA